MAPHYTAPLGGAVTQAFDIWSHWFENVGQMGLINVNLGRTAKPELEKRILQEVGSYGRQIGRISEALEVLIDQADLDRTKLSDAQIAALHDFREMVQAVERCKNA
ncbi:hypothetical protein SAMN06297129_2860 [Pseudooceanicola antarcticus]|uniref:Uncharacterized protein n=1 Tax=Pseudooceanicola antarcticus TaxID=1247613 RepID=A0A285J2N9_9RHOB|nr:hypothetical protein [Pseudooceanicola antarcticus]PJE29742.1 hypothetical protein CVM39_07505 [Pseudooceanicola antarcticus]SNY54590.1 hypothetical protein SAMN06297129_2860 [Pseudooceanicola antarcticus]